MLRCLATSSTIERIAAYDKYGRRNAGPQDGRQKLRCYSPCLRTFYKADWILTFYEALNNGVPSFI